LTKNLPKGHKHFFEGCKPLDLLKDDFAIQAFKLEHLLSVWTGARLDQGVVDEPAPLPGVQSGTQDDPHEDSAPDMIGAYFLLPFVALSLALRNPVLSMQVRMVLLQVAFTAFFEYVKYYPECGWSSGIYEITVAGCQPKPLWTKSMYRRGCNPCLGIFWALKNYGGNGKFQLAFNRIGSHSLECHFGITRSALNGDPQWDRFLSSQVKAVIIHRVMHRLGFHSYIRQFAMSAGCIAPPDSDELVQIGIDDIEELINCIREMLVALSNDRHTEPYAVGLLLLENFNRLHNVLCHTGYLESIHKSGPLSGGAIKNRLLTQPSLGAKTEHPNDCHLWSTADE
jgi:hypothetical protein